MNAARWVLAHEMQLDRERWNMRQWARLLGTDVDLIREEEGEKEGAMFGKAPHIYPLAGIMNPEAYANLVERESGTHTSEIELDQYEMQAAALEKAGMLSDIDTITDTADKMLRDKIAATIVEEEKK